MSITSAPAISGNLTNVLLTVTTASSVPGWHMISAGELGMSGSQLANGIYTNANAQAVVAAATYNGHRTLAIGFQGSNDAEDWRQDFQNINEHYGLFASLITAVNAAVGRGEFDLVLVTGHSLGGAMTQMFMANYQGIAPAYAITAGSPGYLQSGNVADDRIINYQVTDDPIIVLADNRATVGQILSTMSAGELNALALALSTALDFPPETLTSSVPSLTQNYYDRGTNQVLQLPGHPSSPPSVDSLLTSFNADAHDFLAYFTGITNLTDPNPFDLTVGRRGTAGNDALFGTTGTDSIDGGGGIDTLYLHFNRADATITVGPNGPTMVTSSASAADTLASVERLIFADKRLAFDLGADQSAGNTVRVIGAAFDAPSIQQHPDWVGIGLNLFDSGMSMLAVCQLVIGVMGNPGNEAFVNTVYQNVIGSLPSVADRDHFVGLLQGSGGTMTQAELLVLAATIEPNAINIGLVGLQQTGVEFV